MNKREVHIVGCGFLGSNLIFDLCRSDLFKVIHIYDFDKISKFDRYFPFWIESKRAYKVDVIKASLDICFNNISIFSYKQKITSKFYNKFVIDCRDRKDVDINSTISVSLDQNFLIIDCLNSQAGVREFSNYYTKKSSNYIFYATCLIIKFIRQGKYTGRYMYNLIEET